MFVVRNKCLSMSMGRSVLGSPSIGIQQGARYPSTSNRCLPHPAQTTGSISTRPHSIVRTAKEKWFEARVN